MVVFNLAPCQRTFCKVHFLHTISKTEHFTAKLVKNLNDKNISRMLKPNSRRNLPRPQASLLGLTWYALRYGIEVRGSLGIVGLTCFLTTYPRAPCFTALSDKGMGTRHETKYVGMLKLSFLYQKFVTH